MDKTKKLNQDVENMYRQFQLLMGEVHNFHSAIDEALPEIEKKAVGSIRKRLNVGKKAIKQTNMTPFSYMNLIRKGLLDIRKVGGYKHLASNSSFLMLMTNFEYIIKQILAYLIAIYPNLVMDQKITVTLNELQNARSITEVKQQLIQIYLNKFLFQDFTTQLRVVFKFLNVAKGDLQIDFALLEKANKIRNLLVHNRGIITLESLAFLEPIAKKEDIGKLYVVSTSQLYAINEEIMAFGLVLILFLAHRIGAVDFLNKNLTNLLYELLEQKYFQSVEKIYLSIEKIFDPIDDATCICSKINYFIALKHIAGKSQILKKELDNLKFEHFDERYRAPIYVLKNDKKNFITCYKESKIKLEDWKNWPLFEDWRHDRKLFNQIKKVLSENTKKEAKRQKKILAKKTTKKNKRNK